MATTAIFLQSAGGGNALVGLMPIVLMVAVFYFLLLAPQQRRQKKWQQMVSELKTGDKVITNGGIRGTIISIKEKPLAVDVRLFFMTSSPTSRGASQEPRSICRLARDPAFARSR